MAHGCGICGRSFGSMQALHQHQRGSPFHAITHDRETSSAGDEQLRAIMNALGLDGRDRTVSTEDVLDQHERHFPASTSVGRRTHPRSLRLFERGVHKLQATKQKIRHQHTASSWRIVARD